MLQYFVVPLWVTAGIADWWCHRATKIEETTGLKETLIHLLMLGEAGLPVLAGLFLEFDAQVLSWMIAAFFQHEATAMWDVNYAVTEREVTPVEQHVHGVLEMVPLMAVAFIGLHWPQLQELAGLRTEPPKPIRRKKEPLSATYAVGAAMAMLVLEVLPCVEEAVRDWRAHPRRLHPAHAAII
ncbi:MAG TPA: hypothetical protein VHX39_17260 [Acetobacteraceae bacterium]|jgi:hypothetical protein|nr:hypothetical protein [Acetobacteraceae bacterium]